MSESATTDPAEGQDPGQGGNTSGETPAAEEFTPITSQKELNAALKDRLDRERAKFKDYNDIKAKAAKLDEIEQANLSELEKANGRITTAESERDSAKAEALRLRTAVTHGISLEDADLFLTGTDEDLEALSAWNEELRSAALAFDDATFDHTEIFPLLIEDFEPDEED